MSRVVRLTEASEWLLRLNDARRTEQDLNEWFAWCDAHPDNMAAFERMQQDWRELDALKSAAPHTQVEQDAAFAPAPRRTLLFPWRLAASLALLLFGAAAGVYHWYGVSPPVAEVAASSANKTATLPDGSLVVLSARTEVDVAFSAASRRLELSPGEAYFKVHGDKQRPFVVHAGELSVTALGTAFNVRYGQHSIVVTVEEGTVEIASASPGMSGPGQTWRAEAGYQLTYSPSGRSATLAAVNPVTTLKWRHGELAYVWRPLGEVVADVNRYSNRRIVFADEALTAQHFTGTVFTASIDDWLKALQDAYPLRVEFSADGDVVLHATSAAGQNPPR